MLAHCTACGSAALLVAEPDVLYQARIFGELVARHAVEFFRRATAHGKAQLLELAAKVGIAERLDHLGVETRDDLLRRSGGSKNGKPGIEEKPGQSGLVDGRDIGELR